MNLPASSRPPLQPIDPDQVAEAPAPPPGDWCFRHNRSEVIARWIPAGVTVSARRILVLGDVGPGATLFSGSGDARIDVMGNVHEGARLGALGGGAHILIRGTAAPGTLIYASGGGSRVEFLSPSAADVGADGGAAEVLYLGSVTPNPDTRGH